MNTTTPESDWLVMLYLAGDNDLFTFAQTLLSEAKRVGSTTRVKVVAEHDPVDPDLETHRGPLMDGVWESTSIGQTSSTPGEVVEFIQWAKREFPARQRVLVFFDHGNGWQNVHAFEPVSQATGELRLKSLRSVVNQEPTDVLCFDSCLMAMIEIVYELRDRVKYMVAAENVVPADLGWPYDAILRSLTLRPKVSPREVAVAMVDGFGGSYNATDHPVTLAAINVANVSTAVAAIDGLARELIYTCLNGGRSSVRLARQYTQSFGNPDYIDIVSFCTELQRLMPDTPVAAKADAVQAAMDVLVLAFTRGGSRSVAGANGVSIYFPTRPMSAQYRQLDFAKPEVCMWSSFIQMMAPKGEPPIELTVA